MKNTIVERQLNSQLHHGERAGVYNMHAIDLEVDRSVVREELAFLRNSKHICIILSSQHLAFQSRLSTATLFLRTGELLTLGFERKPLTRQVAQERVGFDTEV